MGTKRSTWIGRTAEVLNPLHLDESGSPGERIFNSGKKVTIKGYTYRSRTNPYSYFTISDRKGNNIVTKVPVHCLALDPPETLSDKIWVQLKTHPLKRMVVDQIAGAIGMPNSRVGRACGEMAQRGHLRMSYRKNSGLTATIRATNRPAVLVEMSIEGRKTAFERLAEDLF